MELTDLRHFFHVAETSSFVRAARLSHVTAPAISKAVRKLEGELGVRLFERTTRSVRLTPAGDALRARCERIFRELDGLPDDLEQGGGEPRGRLRIAANEVLSIELLPRALAQLCRAHPSVVPHVYEMIPQRIERALAEGEIDVGFTIGGSGLASGLESMALGESPGVLVCGREHPLYGRARASAASLKSYPSVVPSFLGHEHAPPLDQFPDARWPRRVGATIELLSSGVRLVEEGAFLGYFPEVSVRAQLESGALWSLSGLPRREPFVLSALARPPLRPAASALIALVATSVRATLKPSRSRKAR